MPPQITCSSVLPGKMGKHKILHFSHKCCISALPECNQLLDFFSLFDSRLILMLLYYSLNLVINAFSSGLLRGMIQGKWSGQCCRSWTVLHAQCTSALSSGVPILQGNAEALDRWCGKAKDHLISYFLSNTSAKNYHNWIVYVKIIASQRGTFLRHNVNRLCTVLLLAIVVMKLCTLYIGLPQVPG